MSAQHTPGPWGYTLGQVMRVTTRDQKAVCGVHRIGSHTGNGDPETWAANARLIAAAPELLEALQDFSREYDGFEDGNGDPCPVLAKARAAIAKVVGQ